MLTPYIRPMPPASLGVDGQSFIPCEELNAWVRRVLVDEDAHIVNEDHAHLRHAHIGYLWTDVHNGRGMRTVIGTCELGDPQVMGKWRKARAIQQVEEWFGAVPDFIITLQAGFCVTCSDAEFCALIDHELYHAAQALDRYGQPRFSRDTGKPVFAIRDHDVSEFTGVVRRYGVVSEDVRNLVDAANRRPEIASIHIAQTCGTCANLKAA